MEASASRATSEYIRASWEYSSWKSETDASRAAMSAVDLLRQSCSVTTNESNTARLPQIAEGVLTDTSESPRSFTQPRSMTKYSGAWLKPARLRSSSPRSMCARRIEVPSSRQMLSPPRSAKRSAVPSSSTAARQYQIHREQGVAGGEGCRSCGEWSGALIKTGFWTQAAVVQGVFRGHGDAGGPRSETRCATSLRGSVFGPVRSGVLAKDVRRV